MPHSVDPPSRVTGLEVAGALCAPLVQALRERGIEAAELDGIGAASRLLLASPESDLDWASFRTLFAQIGELYSDAEIEGLGAHFVSTAAGMQLSLLGRLLPEPADLLRWLGASERHRAITCITQAVAERSSRHFRLEMRMADGFEPSREYFIARKGYLLAAAKEQGWKPPRITLSLEGDRAIYDVRLRKRQTLMRLARRLLAGRVADAAELRATIEELQAQREATQLHLDDLERRRFSLRESEARFAHAFDAAPLAMVISTNADGRIREVNQKFVEITGYAREEALGKRATELAIWRSDDDRDEIREARAEQRGAVNVAEAHMQDRHGRPMVVLLSAETISIGNEDCTLWQAVDISERKRVERELAEHRDHLEELVEARTEELQRSREQLIQSERLASVGTLAAGIAHEINNPVGLIHMAAEYALLTVKDDVETGAITQQALETCLSEAQRCGEIVRSILCFASGGSADRVVTDLREVVERSRQLVRSYASAPEYRIQLHMPLEPVWALCSVIEMQQVLVNVLRNAVECGRSDVSIDVQCVVDGDRARIDVTDDGPGIDAAHLGQLFDPFYSTRKAKGGTGLGLSVAHGIVVSHAGSIRAESEPGQGARIIIELPLADPPANPA
jgi:PAS domain S-box-containing protein